MKKINLKLILLTLLLVFVFTCSFAQWQVDNSYRFKINVPSNWSKKSYIDGTDKVYDFYSTDENAAIQLRVFRADNRVTTELLAQVYEQSKLPAGTNKQSLTNYTSVNGIPGKQGIYTLNYNANLINMAVFYTVQNNIGYVLSAMISSSMIAQKGDEVKRITQSFVIDGFGNNTSNAKQPVVNKKENNQNSNSNQSKTSSSRLGLELPKADWKWKDGYWGSGTYKCDKMMGIVSVNGNHIKWSGSSANIPDYRYNMVKGEGYCEVHLVGQYECGVEATLSWESNGKYVITYGFPFRENELSLRVFAPQTGWNNVFCKKVN